MQRSSKRNAQAWLSGRTTVGYVPKPCRGHFHIRVAAGDIASTLPGNIASFRHVGPPSMIFRQALHDPIRRGVALGAAISFHLAILILILRPVIHERDATTDRRSNQQVLQLRLLRRLVPSQANVTAPALRVIAPAMHAHAQRTLHPSQPATPPQVASVSAQPPPDVADTPMVTLSHPSASDDGGFTSGYSRRSTLTRSAVYRVLLRHSQPVST